VVKRVYSGATGGTVGYLRMGYAGAQVAFETDSANTSLTTVYTWGPGVDQLVGVRVSGTDYTVVTDPLGSVRALVRRSDGAWVGRLAYDPYGQLLDSTGPGPAVRYRWTGREWDAETGFYFHRTRYYDPAVGRFVQEDRAGYGGGGNLYAYVDGNVLQARDPDGMIKEIPLDPQPPLDYFAEIRNGMMRGYCDLGGVICRVTTGIAGMSHFGSLVNSVWAGQMVALYDDIHTSDPEMRRALLDCVKNAACADAVNQIHLWGLQIFLDWGSAAEIDALWPGAEGGATRSLEDALHNIIGATTLIDRTYALTLYGGVGLVMTHEFGHAIYMKSMPWVSDMPHSFQELMINTYWNAYYCRSQRSYCE